MEIKDLAHDIISTFRGEPNIDDDLITDAIKRYINPNLPKTWLTEMLTTIKTILKSLND